MTDPKPNETLAHIIAPDLSNIQASCGIGSHADTCLTSTTPLYAIAYDAALITNTGSTSIKKVSDIARDISSLSDTDRLKLFLPYCQACGKPGRGDKATCKCSKADDDTHL